MSSCSVFVVLPVGLFFWRKRRSLSGGAAGARTRKERSRTREEWLYVGKDEDGTPSYLDTQSLSYDPEDPIRVGMWAKYRPLKGSSASLTVVDFLRAAGKDPGPFDYIRQRLEIDYANNLVRDHELVFHDAGGRVIDSIAFRHVEWKAIPPGSLHELLHKTVEGMWRADRFSDDPVLSVKIQEKLKEINRAFEAFETASPDGGMAPEKREAPRAGETAAPEKEVASTGAERPRFRLA